MVSPPTSNCLRTCACATAGSSTTARPTISGNRGVRWNETCLTPRPINGAALIAFVEGHPRLEDLNVKATFDGPVGVREGYSLREHTRMVLDVLRDQEKFYALPTDLRALVVFATILHDIGKPLAVEHFVAEHGHPPSTGEEYKACSARQGTFTYGRLDCVAQRLGFDDHERKVLHELVRGDVIGDAVRGRTTPAVAADELRTVARTLDLEPNVFFAARSLMYVSDAASYPGLRYGQKERPPVFVEEVTGRLLPTAETYGALRALFETAPGPTGLHLL